MANKRILEFASVMTAPDKFIHTREEAWTERASMSVYDMETIMKVMGEAECPGCKSKYCLNPTEIDFEGNTAEAKCVMCETTASIQMTPKTMMMKPGRNLKEVKKMLKQISPSEDSTDKSNNTTTKGEIKMTEPIKKEEPVVIADAEESALSPAEDLKLDDAGAEEETPEVKKEEVKEEEVKKDDEVVIVSKDDEVVTEEAIKKEDIDALKAEIELLKAALAKKDEEFAAQLEKAKKDTVTLVERKSTLGEFAKDMTDEDILNDDKYEIAKLRKENYDLKKGKIEVSSLEVGGEDTKVKKDTPKEFAMGKRVQGLAFGA